MSSWKTKRVIKEFLEHLFYYPLAFSIVIGLKALWEGQSFIEVYSTNLFDNNTNLFSYAVIVLFFESSIFEPEKRLLEIEEGCLVEMGSTWEINQIASWYREHRPWKRLSVNKDSISYRIRRGKLVISKLDSDHETHLYRIEAVLKPLTIFSNWNSEENYHEVKRVTNLLK